MPRVTILPADVEKWIGARPTAPRSAGHHVSRVLLGMLKVAHPRKYGEWGKAADREPQFEPGYIWEDLLSEALAKSPAVLAGDEELLAIQKEIEAGGIYGTPDRISWSHAQGRLIVDECKATWYSFRRLEAKTPDKQDGENIAEEPTFAYWVLQLQTYVAMLRSCSHYSVLNTGLPPVGRVGALFLNGSYRGDRAKPFRAQIEWTNEELDIWWGNVQNFAATFPKSEGA